MIYSAKEQGGGERAVNIDRCSVSELAGHYRARAPPAGMCTGKSEPQGGTKTSESQSHMKVMQPIVARAFPQQLDWARQPALSIVC